MRPTDKDTLRDSLLAARLHFGRTGNKSASQIIATRVLTLLAGRHVGCAFVYLSTNQEVSTDSLIDNLIRSGTSVLVPRIINKTKMVAVAFPGWDNLRPGALGIPSPPDDTPWQHQIDLAVVPGLGFSMTGERLGHGAGYYDRWLEEYPKIVKIGVAFDYQIVACVPAEAHDVRMDFMLTETRSARTDSVRRVT